MTTAALVALAVGGLGATVGGAYLLRPGRADHQSADTQRDAEHSGLIPGPAGPSPTEQQEELTW